jgi:hypothetical protein
MAKTPLYSYLPQHYANPGTGNYAFAPNTTLPALSLGGAGRITMAQFGVMQPPQSMSYPTVTTDGLGGLIAGQFVGQSLMTRNENG